LASLTYRVHVNLSAGSLWLMALPLPASVIRGVIQPIVKFGFEWWPNPIAAVVVSYTGRKRQGIGEFKSFC
jgi:hypothetical protein